MVFDNGGSVFHMAVSTGAMDSLSDSGTGELAGNIEQNIIITVDRHSMTDVSMFLSVWIFLTIIYLRSSMLLIASYVVR